MLGFGAIITDEHGLISDPALRARMIHVITPYLIFKTGVFFAVPFLNREIRTSLMNILILFVTLLSLSIFGDLIFGVLGGSLFYRLVEFSYNISY